MLYRGGCSDPGRIDEDHSLDCDDCAGCDDCDVGGLDP
jgi:hypothetical protein